MEIGHYRAERQLADRPREKLYEARDPNSGARVVVRTVERKADASLLTRLKAQVQAVAKLRALGAVGFTDCGSDKEGQLYIVTPFVDGKSLHEHFSHNPGQPLPGALRIGHELAQLLAQAHGAGITHLALRPTQVLLVGAELRVIGLGLRQVIGLLETPSDNSADGILRRSYLAPEQQGSDAGATGDASADVFALGVILWRALSGSNPFLKGDANADGGPTLRSHDATLPGFESRGIKVPRELPILLVRMLSMAASERPSMSEVAEFFASHIGETFAAPSSPALAPTPPAGAGASAELSAEDVPTPDSFQIHVSALKAPQDGSQPDPMTGTLFGNFRIVRKLGEGGMGVVYEARHRKIGRRAAVKVMHRQFAQNADFAARFLNEARAVNIISHPGLVEIFEYGRLPDGTLFIVMEFLEGESLIQRMQLRPQPFSEVEAIHIGKQLARALAGAHEKGIIHRDLKPENIMLVPDPITQQQDWVKILDFGVAKVSPGSRWNAPSSRTEEGATIGTPKYMAPEQFGQAETVDGRADVFSLGVVLYEMLTGKAPYPGVSLSLFKRQLVPLHESCPGISRMLEELISRMLDPQAEKRPSMAEVAKTLARIQPTGSFQTPLKAQPADSLPPSEAAPAPSVQTAVQAPQQPAPKPRRALFYALLGVCAAILIAGVLIIRWQLAQRSSPGRAQTLALAVVNAGLHSQNATSQLRALAAVAQSGDLRYRALLEPLLASDNPQLAAEAAHALGQLGAVEAQPALLELSRRHPEPGSVILVADALARLKHPEGIRLLLDLMEHGEPEIRLRAATLLLEQGNLAGASMLWERVSRGNLSEMASLVTLGQLAFAGEQRAQQMLEATLPRLSGQARLFAAWNLGRLGNEDARVLLLSAADQPGADQLLAAQLAAALGEPRGYDLLLREAGAEKEPDAVRELAIAGLSDCNRPEAIPVLSRILARSGASEALQITAAGAILHLLSGDRVQLAQQSLSWAMAALGSDSAVTRELATAALGEIGSDDAIPPLSKALRDQQREVRRGAARALGRKSARAALDALSGSLEDQDVEVRAAGLRAIHRVLGSLHSRDKSDKSDSDSDKRIVNRLEKLAKEGSAQDRVVASGILLQLGDSEQEARLLEALSSRDGRIRKLALEYASADEALLGKALRDSDRSVRFAAARRLAEAGSHLGVAVLREIAQGGELDGLVAYTKLKALGEAAEPPPGLAQLLHSADLQTRLDALDAVADFPAEQALPLLYIASRDPAIALRRRSAEIAGEFYKRTNIGPYLSLLRNLLRDPDALVRSGASDLLLSLSAKPSGAPQAAASPAAQAAPPDGGSATAAPTGTDGQVRFIGEESVRVQIDDTAPQAISNRLITLPQGSHRISYLGGKSDIKVVPGSVVAVQIPTTYAEQLLHDGVEAYQAKQYERAREHFERLRVMEGRGRVKRSIIPDIAFNLGRSYEMRKDTARAMQEYGKFLEMPEARKRSEMMASAQRSMAKLSNLVGHFVVYRPNSAGKCEKSNLYLPPGKHLIDVGMGKSEVVRSQARTTQTLNKCP